MPTGRGYVSSEERNEFWLSLSKWYLWSLWSLQVIVTCFGYRKENKNIPTYFLDFSGFFKIKKKTYLICILKKPSSICWPLFWGGFHRKLTCRPLFGQDMNLLNEVDQLLTISGAAWAASIYLYASKKEFSEEALLGTSTFGNLQSLTLEAFEFCVFFCHDFLQNRFFCTQKISPTHSFWMACWVWRSSFFFKATKMKREQSIHVCLQFLGPGCGSTRKNNSKTEGWT